MPPMIPTARSRLSGQMFGNRPAQNSNPSGAAGRLIGSPLNHQTIPVGRPQASGGGMGGVDSARPATPSQPPAQATATQGMAGNALSAML